MNKQLYEVEMFITAAKRLVTLGDEWVNKTREEHGDMPCDTCRSSGCCYRNIAATPAEGMYIAHYLNNLGLNTSKYQNLLLTVGEKMEEENVKNWHDEAIPCCFLGEKNRCKIYPWRPISCRTYFVASDPVHCIPPKLRSDGQSESCEVSIPDNIQVASLSLILSQGVIVANGHAIKRPFIRSLPSMVSVMLRAIQATNPESFWKIVLADGTMSDRNFEKMIGEKQHKG